MRTDITERQKKWVATLQASLERDTGRTLEEWVAIAKTCPETKPRARVAWFKEHHGLGQNRALQVLSAAFPPDPGSRDPEAIRAALWSDTQSAAIYDAVAKAAASLPDVVIGQRKQATAFSRKVQFAAARPMKGGKLMLGLALETDADPRLETPKNEAWSERLHGRMLLESPADVDDSVKALLKAAWERS